MEPREPHDDARRMDVSAIAPRPPLVPREVVEHGDFDGHPRGQRGRHAPRLREPCNCGKLNDEADRADPREGDPTRRPRTCPTHAAPPGSGSSAANARALRTALIPKTVTIPTIPQRPPTSQSRIRPRPKGITTGRPIATSAPIESRIRSSVGPNQPNEIRKTPTACVARKLSAASNR